MVVKNYKEMCRLLEEKEKSGASKRSQLNHWECYIHWVKDGHKFIIKEIYDEPTPFEDGRADGNNSKYVKLIEWILAQDLVKREGYTHTLTRKKWWALLGMVNNQYDNVSDKELRALSTLHDDKEIHWFYNRSNSVLNEILRNALKSMCDRSLIDYEIETIIVRPNSEGGWFKAEDKDIAELQLIIKDNLRKRGLTKEREIFNKNMQGDFYSEVNNTIKERFGWDRYFKQIKIIFNPENIRKSMQELEEDFLKEVEHSMIKNKILELNEKIVTRMNDDAVNRWNKTIENYYNGKSTFLFPSNYIEAQESLTRCLIDIKYIAKNVPPLLELSSVDMQELDDLFMDTL